MKSIKGTRTAENLLRAFAGESQARNRYTFYASVAKKEGFVQVSDVFTKTADNEKEHAEQFFYFLNECAGENIGISADYPVGIKDTLQNLAFAAAGEHEEWSSAYPEFAAIAQEEGFPEVADRFRNIASIEKHHEQRYNTLHEKIKSNSIFQSQFETDWMCSNCGFVHKGLTPPEACPVCIHPKGYFELFKPI